MNICDSSLLPAVTAGRVSVCVCVYCTEDATKLDLYFKGFLSGLSF